MTHPIIKKISNLTRTSWYRNKYQNSIAIKNKSRYAKLRPILGEEGFNFLLSFVNNINIVEGYKSAAWFLSNVGLTDEAIPILEECLDVYADQEALTFYLQGLMFSTPSKFSHQYLYDAYTKWGKRICLHPVYTSHKNERTLNRRLRVGYTCHFITNSTSTTLLAPILKAHNRDRVEIFMYSDQNPDEIPKEIRESVEHWQDIITYTDEEFSERIYQDKIDIMLELNGHVIKNRYRALSKKPAPIQVNYYNHAATCGVPGIDYILLGEDFDIDHLQPYYSEKIFHKKGITLATVVGNHFPVVTEAPFQKNKFITFGSFGQSHKVSLATIEVWSTVLRNVPNSKLFFKTNVLDFPIYKNLYEKYFSDYGIDKSRLILEGPSDYQTLLESYSKVDIALDTLPYPAGTTTMEACICGVPVISHVDIGDRLSAKIGFFNLNSIEHTELLGKSRADYIEKAVELANNPDRIIHYRKTLRNDVMNSRRANLSLFVNELEDAYFEMWQQYLDQSN